MKIETKLHKLMALDDSDSKLNQLWLLGCRVPNGCAIAITIGGELDRLVKAGFRFIRYEGGNQ